MTDSQAKLRLEGTASADFPWGTLVLLLVYLVVLCAVGVFGPAGRGPSVWELQDSAGLRDWLLRWGGRGLLQVLRFLPVGFLVWLVAARWFQFSRGRNEGSSDGKPVPVDPRRVLKAGGQLLATAAAAAVVAACVRTVELGRPAPLALLLLPTAGCLLGVWISRGWWKGGRSRLWLAHQLMLLASLSAAGLVGLLILAVDHVPLGFEPAQISSDHKRRLVAAIRASEVGGTDERRLQLSEEDINFLLAWGLSLGSGDRKARVLFREGAVLGQASLGLPVAGKRLYLNGSLVGRAQVWRGQPRVRIDHLQVGGLQVPALIANLAAPRLLEVLQEDPEAGPVLASIRELQLKRGGLQLAARRGDFTGRVLPGLAVRLGAEPDVQLAVVEYLKHLVAAGTNLPPGDAGFTASMQVAFRLARQRSEHENPVLENTAAIYALGILLGHPRVERLVGRVADPALRPQLYSQVGRFSVRGRSDWVQHFWVSAALALISSEAASDAVGLLKEELDADGGSGFSFSDLLADRAGTLFALAATHDEAAARQVQQQLAAGVELQQLFPPAADLPEGISDAKLRQEYGGVGGPRYAALLAEIEQRLATCALLQVPGKVE